MLKLVGGVTGILQFFNNVISEYCVSVNKTELYKKNCICYFKQNLIKKKTAYVILKIIKSQQYKQNNVLMFYSYYFSKASNLQTV